MSRQFQILTIFFVCIIFNASWSYGSTFDNILPIFADGSETFEIQKYTDKDLVQNSIVKYNEALQEQSPDSVQLFKNLALSNAAIGDGAQSVFYAEKYIANSVDFSILEDISLIRVENSKEYIDLKETYEPKMNVFVFLYIYVAFIGFYFAFTINFKKRVDKTAIRLVSGFIFIHSIFILEFIFFISNYRYKFPHILLISSLGAMLYGPLLYFYFKRITQNYRFRLADLLHLLPTAIMLVVLMPVFILPAAEKTKIALGTSDLYSMDMFFYTIFIPKLASLIAYGILITKFNFSKKLRLTFKNSDFLTKWKKNVYGLHVIFVLSYLVYGITVSGIFIPATEWFYYSQVMAMSLMVIYMAHMSYVQPEVFKGNIKLLNPINIFKYKKSGLTPSYSIELKKDLLRLLDEDKIYKENNLNLDVLSEKLGTTRHNTSQIINEHFKMNFAELMNKYRIDEAVEIFNNDEFHNLNIIQVAYEVGFNNKVTFNKSFKKYLLQTPSQYITSLNS